VLQVLLADHLLPRAAAAGGELDDIRKARTEAKGRGKAERRFRRGEQSCWKSCPISSPKVTEVAERRPAAT